MSRAGIAVAVLTVALGTSAWVEAAGSSSRGEAAETVSIAFQTSGPFRVRSYMVWEGRTGEAALIDPGSDVDRLLDTLRVAGLSLKYVLLTHGHQDHVASLSAVHAAFPRARLGYSALERESFAAYTGWRTLFDSASVAKWEGGPTTRALMDEDYRQVPPPDVALRDGQVLRLGRQAVRVLCTPGHSPGSLTFAIGRQLFPGDLILYHETGFMDYPLASREQITASIRRLYALFPNESVLHAGHGEDSTIGTEKRANLSVTGTEVKWEP